MSVNLQNLKTIEAELLEFSMANAKPSKVMIIRRLYPTITEVLSQGLSASLLCDFLKQKGLSISTNYLYLVLHRIKKEGEETHQETHQPKEKKTKQSALENSKITASNTDDHNKTEAAQPISENYYDELLVKYKQCDNQIDKYVVLGGKREDIEEQNISTQRSMVMALRNKLRQKYKGIY